MDNTLYEGAAPEQMPRPVLLRSAREAAGLHIAALAAALKVPVKKLEALEAGRYEELPDMTFARALASSACRQLKIDPAPVLQQIPVGATPHLGDSMQAINTPFKPQQEISSSSPMGWLSRPAVLLTFVLLLAALVLIFLPSMERLLPDAVLPTTELSTGVPGADAVDLESSSVTVTPLVLDSSMQTASAAVASAATTAGAAAPAEVTGTRSEPPAEAAPGSNSLLSITANGESWVEVVNGSGSVVMQRMLKAGDVIEFSSAPPYAVVLGRANAVRVAVRGKPFDIDTYARNNVARFEVK